MDWLQWAHHRSLSAMLEGGVSIAGKTFAMLVVVALASVPALAKQPGWQISPLPGEGDRASIGCARDATPQDHACLVVRCESNFSVGVHIMTTRRGGAAGLWEMTVDRENRAALAVAGGPYDGRFVDDADWLVERLRHGTFVYLRHSEDFETPFRFIDLSGSMQAIGEALYFCAPRTPEPPEPEE